ncbi:unnamed protein product [Enterobius vermicularis]|uniref:Adenylate cyclase-stimulating G alpha protein n=1 Tax=Enterobius vermicularis TaxID=51028 RepID=A0A0N4VNU3_ENTVE|nr:unnamed protein product [Enterobius vermicularis]
MNKIDPPVQLDNQATAESKEYLLTETQSPDFDYPQSFCQLLVMSKLEKKFEEFLPNTGDEIVELWEITDDSKCFSYKFDAVPKNFISPAFVWELDWADWNDLRVSCVGIALSRACTIALHHENNVADSHKVVLKWFQGKTCNYRGWIFHLDYLSSLGLDLSNQWLINEHPGWTENFSELQQIYSANTSLKGQHVTQNTGRWSLVLISPTSLIFYDHVIKCWSDRGVQTCFERNFQRSRDLTANNFSFLDKIAMIRRSDYIPSEQDILRCRVMTTGIFETKFEVDRVRFHVWGSFNHDNTFEKPSNSLQFLRFSMDFVQTNLQGLRKSLVKHTRYTGRRQAFSLRES